MPKADRAEAAPCCPPITAGQLSEADATELAALFAALVTRSAFAFFPSMASEGEVCSCNLEDPLGKSQPTISHHTWVLADAGLIVGERRGRWTWWRAVPEEIRRLQGSLGGDGDRSQSPDPRSGHSMTVDA